MEMPPKGWKTVSIRETLYEALEKLGKTLTPKRSVADTIEYLFNMRKVRYADFAQFSEKHRER